MKKTTVLIMDDSLYFRELLTKELESDVNIKVVAKAASAYEARDGIVLHAPDILIADVKMEKMNGIEFVKMLLPQYFLPVIMISGDSSYKKAAEEINGVTFYEKPQSSCAEEQALFFKRIIIKIKEIVNKEKNLVKKEDFFKKIIAIGASTGGAEAVENVLKHLPCVTPPVVIAVHMPPKFTRTFADRLNSVSKISVKEALHGDILIPGQAYIAPGGMHTSVIKKKNQYYIKLSDNSQNSQVCPCIDILLKSVADQAGGTASLGVILTGMGKDGAEGLLEMRKVGCKTIVQDEKTSVVYGMPKVAYEIGAANYQLPLDQISKKITALMY